MTLTTAEQTRLLMADTDPGSPIFSDDEVAAFLSLANNEILLAAAMGLDAMAANNANVLKVVTIMGLQVDGEATAAALRAQAQSLRDQWELLSPHGMPFGTAEFADDAFQRREYIWKHWTQFLVPVP